MSLDFGKRYKDYAPPQFVPRLSIMGCAKIGKRQAIIDRTSPLEAVELGARI